MLMFYEIYGKLEKGLMRDMWDGVSGSAERRTGPRRPRGQIDTSQVTQPAGAAPPPRSERSAD